MRNPKEETKDLAEKEFLSFPDIAADVINALLYQGKKVTDADKLLTGPTESIYQGFIKLRNQYEDLCKCEMANGKIHLMYLIPTRVKPTENAAPQGGLYRRHLPGTI